MARSMEAIIGIAGKLDPSLSAAVDSAKNKINGLDKAGAKSSKNASKMQSAWGKVGKALKTGAVVTGAAVAAASSGIAALTGAAVKQFAEYEQLVGGVDTLFKGSSKTVQDYANAAYKTAGISANDYMSTVTSFSASMINSLGGDTAKAAEMANMAVTDMSDNANKMGTDMSEIQRAYQSMARGNWGMLDSLKLGYGGVKSEGERLIKDANEILKSQGKEANLTMGNFADVAQAIHLVQEQMGITGTTAKEAATTIEGSVNSAKAAWTNWLTGLGNENADLGLLTDQLMDSITTAASNILPRVQTILTRLGSWFAQSAPGIIQQLASGIATAAPQLISTAGSCLMALAQGIVASAPTLLSTGFQIILMLANGIMQNIPTIIAMGVQLIGQFAQACAAYLPVLIPIGVQAIINLVIGLAQNLPTIVAYAGQIIVALGQGIANAIPLLIEQGPQIITSLVSGIIGAAGALVQAGWELLGALAQGILGGLADLGGSIVDAIGRMLTGQPLEVPAEVNEVDTSALSGADVPTLDTNAELTGVDMSALDATSLPTLEMPPVEIPEVDTSSLEGISIPEIDTSSLDAISNIQMPTIDTSSLSGMTADYSGLVSGAESAKSQIVSTFSGIGAEISAQMAGITADYSGITNGASTAATTVTTSFANVGTGIGTAISSGLSGATSAFSSFTSMATSSAMQIMSSQTAAATMVMSIWTMSLSMVSARALATVSAFVQMAAAGQSAASSIAGSMSGVAGTISGIASAAMSATSALNAMASAARSASAAAASASAAKAAGFAHGGFTAGPSLAGEDPRYPTEAVISFNPAYRSQNIGYLARAAQMLGVSNAFNGQKADWTRIGEEISTGKSNLTTITTTTNTIDVGGIEFSPVINISGDAKKEDIVGALRQVYPEVVDLIKDVLADMEVGSYAYDV